MEKKKLNGNPQSNYLFLKERLVTMSKKPNRQVKTEFFRKRDGDWDKELKKYVYSGDYTWHVKVHIVDHDKHYSFTDQNFSLEFSKLEEAKSYADSLTKEVLGFLDKEDG